MVAQSYRLHKLRGRFLLSVMLDSPCKSILKLQRDKNEITSRHQTQRGWRRFDQYRKLTETAGMADTRW